MSRKFQTWDDAYLDLTWVEMGCIYFALLCDLAGDSDLAERHLFILRDRFLARLRELARSM